MASFPLAFASPYILLALISLPIIWWLLKLTPPRPQAEVFPPLRILMGMVKPQETPAKSPWWLTLLRLAMAAAVILAMAQPVWNPSYMQMSGKGPILLVIDDSWAAGKFWKSQKETALGIVDEADRQNRSVILAFTASGLPQEDQLLTASDAAEIIEGKSNLPLKVDSEKTAKRIEKIARDLKPSAAYWLSDGLSHDKSQKFAETLNTSAEEVTLFVPDTNLLVAMGQVDNDPELLQGKLKRLASASPLSVQVSAYDKDAIAVATARAQFDPDSDTATFKIPGPVELRNQIARLQVEEANNAGSVRLLDERFRRRLVGLVTGENFDQTQPLLSPLYYVRRALEPYSDLRKSSTANLADAVPDLINQGVSAIVLTDVGQTNEEVTERLTNWIAKGGLLLRFAGPRLAASSDKELLPVELRPGDRDLGGALTWEKPKELAPFPPDSPLFRLKRPQDIIVKRQVLALKSLDLDGKTWASLEDGTPLVTAEKRGAGWIVLVHTSSGNDWSNLPLSGSFVEMLRRIISISSASGIKGNTADLQQLPPLSVLDGRGEMVAPDITVKPLLIEKGKTPKPDLANPPGQYGTEDGYYALNLFSGTPDLVPVSKAVGGLGFNQQSYSGKNRIDLVPWLLALAALLLLIDCLAVLWINGALRPRPVYKTPKPAAKRGAVSHLIAILALGAVFFAVFSTAPGWTGLTSPALAQEQAQKQGQEQAQKNSDETIKPSNDPPIDFSATLITKLGYVKTGVSDVDETSRAGLKGLTYFLSTRTSLEPGEAVGLDVETDELNFYPLIYWPIDSNAPFPSQKAMARIDAYMKQGGSILFDTRDQLYGSRNGSSRTPEAQYLQRLLTDLDIPPLEPVPVDHVLTKSFYLLSSFPGRYSGGALWVEAQNKRKSDTNRPVRRGDGVSSIMITSNDFAGAWAVDANNYPLYSTIPPDPNQREYSYRSGVNLVMYTLTGNYKADQVHIPALLERLGQ